MDTSITQNLGARVDCLGKSCLGNIHDVQANYQLIDEYPNLVLLLNVHKTDEKMATIIL